MLHSTVWEEDGLAGIKCKIAPELYITLDSEDGPKPCPGCGTILHLIWRVYIEELEGKQE